MLAFGVVAGLCTIAGIGAYTYTEVRRLRDEQTAISERNRKDSLQLLRIQNALASLAVLMRDMVEGTEPYPLHGWQPAFERVRQDLDEATRLEQALAPAVREPAQQQRLVSSLAAYWTALGGMFAISRADEAQARDVVGNSLIPQQRAIDGLVSQFLVVNNQVQEEAARANRAVYDRVARQILLLVAVLLAVTGLLGLWVVAVEPARVPGSRRPQRPAAHAVLAHAPGAGGRPALAVARAARRLRADRDGHRHAARSRQAPCCRRGGLASELEQVRTIAQQTLDRIRSRSQWLHPGVLDDFGLARAIEGAVEQFQRQTGIRTHLAASGPLDSVREDCAIHVYRIVQEALSNAARHSGSPEAWVRIDCRNGDLQLDVEDHGSGIAAAPPGATRRAAWGW